MLKKLTKTGNSLALVLDKPLLDRAQIDADTPLEVSTDADVIVITPVRDRRRTARLKRVGLMVLLAFLGLNSRRLDANAQEVEDLVLGIASGRVSKAEAAVFVQQHLRPRSGK